jgi:hypothetical protein
METVVFGRVMLINEARFNGDRRTYILHVAHHADLMQTRSPSTQNRAIPHARDDRFGGLVWMVIQPVDSLSVVHYIRPCFGYPQFLRNWFLETDRFLNGSTFFS